MDYTKENGVYAPWYYRSKELREKEKKRQEIKNLFTKYQKPIISGLNHWALGTPFRKLLGIDHECQDKITKLIDNSYETRIGKNKFQSTIRSYPVFAKRMGIALSKWDIIKDYISGNTKLYKGLDEYRGLLAEIGLLDYREFPVVMATVSDPMYSDAGGDGFVRAQLDGRSFTDTRNLSTAEDLYDTDTYLQPANHYISVNYYPLMRAFLPFDVSALGSITISAGTLTLNAEASGTADSESIVVVQTTQADPEALALGDYSKCGSLNNPTEVSSRKTISSWPASGNTVEFSLNNNGYNMVDNGWMKFGLRTSGDVDNEAPSGLNYAQAKSSNEAGIDKDPKLVVTYTLATTTSTTTTTSTSTTTTSTSSSTSTTTTSTSTSTSSSTTTTSTSSSTSTTTTSTSTSTSSSTTTTSTSSSTTTTSTSSSTTTTSTSTSTSSSTTTTSTSTSSSTSTTTTSTSSSTSSSTSTSTTTTVPRTFFVEKAYKVGKVEKVELAGKVEKVDLKMKIDIL